MHELFKCANGPEMPELKVGGTYEVSDIFRESKRTRVLTVLDKS